MFLCGGHASQREGKPLIFKAMGGAIEIRSDRRVFLQIKKKEGEEERSRQPRRREQSEGEGGGKGVLVKGGGGSERGICE